MGGRDNNNLMQRVNSSSATSSSLIPKHPSPISPNHHLNPSLIHSHQQFPQFRQSFGGAVGGNRVGAPPVSPYSQIPATLQLRHSRSNSQPSSYIPSDSLPPLNPSPISVEERNSVGFSPSLPPSPFSSRIIGGDGDNLPPRKSHRRSNSDVTFGFNQMMMSPNQIPSKSLERSISGGEASDWSNLVKDEPRFFKGRKPDSEVMDDVFNAYMNLDNIDLLNSFGGEGGSENGAENNSSHSKKTNGESSMDSEGESSGKVVVSSSSGVKRRAGGDIVPTGRHYRSVSVDSCFTGKMSLGDESSLNVSPTNSGEGNSSGYSVEFGNSEFSAAEMKKISADEKLAEIVMSDPKRVKRILANRVSAARSKERKTRYMAELEHKVQTLQTEATTLSAQLTHLQRESMDLTNQNNELKFRFEAMHQQAQIRDALSETLNQEVQRLKRMIGQQSGGNNESNRSKTTLNPEMFQQLSINQSQRQQMNRSNQNSTP